MNASFVIILRSSLPRWQRRGWLRSWLRDRWPKHLAIGLTARPPRQRSQQLKRPNRKFTAKHALRELRVSAELALQRARRVHPLDRVVVPDENAIFVEVRSDTLPALGARVPEDCRMRRGIHHRHWNRLRSS